MEKNETDSALARSLMHGEPLPIDQIREGEPVSIDGRKALPLLRTSTQTIGIEFEVASVLLSNPKDLAKQIGQVLQRLEVGALKSSEDSLWLPNGVVYSAHAPSST